MAPEAVVSIHEETVYSQRDNKILQLAAIQIVLKDAVLVDESEGEGPTSIPGDFTQVWNRKKQNKGTNE